MQVIFTFRSGISKEPAEFLTIIRGKFVVAVNGNHACGRSSEKKDHIELRVMNYVL
ncbi:hypothetical protein JCM15093_2683 [Bacteroides graminisolvens DSM 19988 = JCM 15093]|jgi:hypothetical protein|uniref:Uncharacterized protein n=2 Tax=root TaxID=1 RepID=A0A069D4U8_9BACE|nr:hypothetical protein JCM15093_2683 [Bacteroides graminisolvens DSM 19988 = JCM 15093]